MLWRSCLPTFWKFGVSIALEPAKTLLPIFCCQESRYVQAECGLQRSSAKLLWYSNLLGVTAGGSVECGIEKCGAGGLADCAGRALLWEGLGTGGGAKSETRLRFAFGLPLERVILTSVLKSDENPGFRCLKVTI